MSKIIPDIDYHPLSDEELYEKLKANPNNFSNWFPRLKERSGNILLPKSIIIPLPLEWLKWLMSDSYDDEKTEEFDTWLHDRVIEEWNKHKDYPDILSIDLFMKTGQFSDKFDFSKCHIPAGELHDLGSRFLDIFYSSMCVGCPESPEVIIREYIPAPEWCATIYNGMPLRPEFRIFYDFKHQRRQGRIVGYHEYWDKDVMMNGLFDEKDKETFSKFYPNIHALTMNAAIQVVPEKIEYFLKDVQMPDYDGSGIWSIDFMKESGNYYLIDMAISEMSYYREEIENADIENPIMY